MIPLVNFIIERCFNKKLALVLNILIILVVWKWLDDRRDKLSENKKKIENYQTKI